MSDYDALAAGYDSTFSRPVDRWEDERLAAALRPVVNGRSVLDLGCGTGWLLDHLAPASYTGVDSSASMLEVLSAKHPQITVIKAEVGAPGWVRAQWGEPFDAVTATWAFQYLFATTHALQVLLAECSGLVRPGGTVALHGYLPRYRHRRHYIGWPSSPPVIRPAQVRQATARTRPFGLSGPKLTGCGALPDGLAINESVWKAALLTPARWHYSGLWVWTREG